MKIRLYSSIKSIFTKNNINNSNINYNQQLKTIHIPSNIITKKEPSLADNLDQIMKLIIKRLDRIDQRNKGMISQLKEYQ